MDSEPFLGFRRTLTAPDSTSSDSQPPLASSSSVVLLLNHTNSTKHHKLNRCKTAPAMVVMRDIPTDTSTNPKPNSASLLQQAAVLLIIYLSIGVIIFCFNRNHFSGLETHPVVDGLYFCIVTMCTIGYGDIAPVTPSAKVFACFFVLIGFGFIDIMLSGVVNYVLDLQENMIINANKANQNHNNNNSVVQHNTNRLKLSPIDYIYDFAKGRMRIRLKVCLALGVVLLSIGIGTLVLYSVERLDLVDSLYLSVLSVTTVGYGDRAFRTLRGRLFASFWLLFSTLMVARAFLYLAEARIDKRHRRVANWVLHRQITVEDLLAADLNNSGFLSKSEYIVFKLKEMGKIEERDILQICNQFNKLDSSNSGKITLRNLLSGHSI
ncbi:putative Two pore domain potassium channel, EF-hand domain pair, EF-Hand 1, calcium-binding protein [Helianthus annuus]|uniref:Putative ca2+ activated outward rectifying K+ channel 5 n=1 Tax=Helianthus annuus TaxID=4232 RepID=A0A251TJU0_HELAN|nr:two-pore potassium channel 5 [Helianthus annuus]KAJ0512872.1 putative Two pore domain potassium channel, EF-hand domain pair, EF-Hand 1, calcium-binding protein [Helianthus annuus]KAJ0528995.1 putative Two pore domain potassium channel, EF-hand domain pair, EF-Hand 1, calcium-binding protein [Helianthus annuus]KAJ0695911.1 putative Two pore domain potassium channel, EF-hand domain pair, EF-Hand 1, calcium-binding protein [Helianthus annuus]